MIVNFGILANMSIVCNLVDISSKSLAQTCAATAAGGGFLTSSLKQKSPFALKFILINVKEKPFDFKEILQSQPWLFFTECIYTVYLIDKL